MKIRILVATALTCGLSACAVAPESIAPAYVSDIPYQGYSCAQLGQEDARVGNALTTAYGQQNSARSSDTVGILLLGLPVSSLSGGNVAPQIASLKGQQDAIRQAAIAKNCPVGPAPVVITHDGKGNVVISPKPGH